MTTNAVNWQNKQLDRAVDKEIAELDRKVDFAKLGISADELKEKIRHNKAEEYLSEKNVNANDRNGFMSGLGSILRGLGGGLIGGLVSLVANDESYHNKLTEAYDQATNLPFSEKAGNNHNWELGGYTIDDIADVDRSSATPNSGIVHVRYVPTISVNDQEIQSSELQNNVRLLWTRVRSANSGAINQYDQSDLMQFTLASSSVFEILRAIVRPLNYINSVRKPMNVFSAWDETMLAVMCGSAANARKVINEKTEFIQAINSAIRAANSQILPIGFDLTKRRSLLNGRIFTHLGNRDEFYLFTPSVYYVYDEANAQLVSKAFNPSSVFVSPDTVKAVLNEMLQPLVNGTATSIMAGDMHKAYPKQVQSIRELPYTLKGDIYSQDEHILEALRNANIMSSLTGVGGYLNIKQGINANLDTFIYQGNLIDTDDGKRARLYCGPSNSFNDAAVAFDTTKLPITKTFTNILDVKKDKPEKYDIMAGTRFKTSFDVSISVNDDNEISTVATVKQWGTEIITDVYITYFENEAKFNANNPSTYWLVGSVMYRMLTLEDYISYEKLFYSRFHYLPMLFKQPIFNEDSNGFDVTDIIHGRYNCIKLLDTELMHLNNASFGSLVSIKDYTDNSVE